MVRLLKKFIAHQIALLHNEAVNPSSDTIKRCEIYKALSDDDSAKYTKLWQELLSY
jgi:spermidine/putrescine transport system permease protein